MTPKALFDAVNDQIGGLERSGPGGWFGLPECLNPDCRKEYHMFFNPEKGFVCHKCETKGGIKAFITLLRLNGYNVEDGSSPLPPLPDLLAEFDGASPEAPQDLDSVPLPMGFKLFNPHTGEMPYFFLDERRYEHDLILKLGFGYCSSGPYRQRIIVPLETMGRHSFLAYEPSKGFFPDIKVLDAKNCKKSKFLFPYSYVEQRLEPDDFLVIVEGVTDALRILNHRRQLGKRAGWPLALLGKTVSRYQLDAIDALSKKGYRVIVVLDSDTSAVVMGAPQPTRAAHDIARRLGADKVWMVDIASVPPQLQDAILKAKGVPSPPQGGGLVDIDPDDVRDPEHWLQVLEHAQSLEWCLI